MKKTQWIIIFIGIAIMPLLTACSTTKVVVPLTTEEITKENISDVSTILRAKQLSNIDVFENWVKGFHENSEDNLGSAGFSDADCRMTVMLLTGDLINSNSTEQEYKGTYLMFDLDAIENDETFQILRNKKDLFTTLFGEIPIGDRTFKEAFPNNWDKHGIKLNCEKCTIVSIVFKTYEGDAAFVGHTGVLIDCRNDSTRESDYLFVEKIAFGAPFQVTKLNKPEELIEVFSKRPDYFSEEGEQMPLVFLNNEYLGELKSHEKE